MSSVDGQAIEPQEHPVEGRPPSVWAPLRNRVYRNLFMASFGSNIGTWMQGVAAQWFLVEQHSPDVVVALVQTASLGRRCFSACSPVRSPIYSTGGDY